MPDIQQLDTSSPLSWLTKMAGDVDVAKTAQSSALQQLRDIHSGVTPVEASDEGSRWGAIAGGLGAIEPTGGAQDFAKALAMAGGSYGKELARQFKENRGNLEKGADLEFQDAGKRLTALESKYMSALTATNKPGAQGRWVSRQVPGTGEVMLFNSMTGEERPLSSNDTTLLKSMEDKYLKVADKAGYVGTEAVQWAKEMAAADLAGKPKTTSYQVAGTPQAPLQTTTPFAPAKPPTLVEPGIDRAQAIAQLQREQKLAEGAQDYNRATQIQKAIQAFRTSREATPEELKVPATPEQLAAPEDISAAPVTPPPVVAPKPVLQDLRPDVKRKEAYAGEQGKDLAKERNLLAQGEQASNTMENQLQLLKRLYATNADVAQGEGAATLKSIKSTLKTLGVDVGETSSLEDIIQATASNMALHMRTSEGQNLMPGSMSNYEDKLLQGMAPGLSMTSEGRKAMIEFMLDITKTNKRIAQEATQYEAKNKQLDPGWYARRERVMKEEQARLTRRRNEIMAQFGSK